MGRIAEFFRGYDMLLNVKAGQPAYLGICRKHGELFQKLPALRRCGAISAIGLIADSFRDEHAEPSVDRAATMRA